MENDQIRSNLPDRLYADQEQFHLVFAMLGRDWVLEAARGAFVYLPAHAAVTLGDWRAVGQLPLTEWGRVEW